MLNIQCGGSFMEWNKSSQCRSCVCTPAFSKNESQGGGRIVQTPYLAGVLIVKFFLFLGERKEAAALGADLPQIVVQGGL